MEFFLCEDPDAVYTLCLHLYCLLLLLLQDLDLLLNLPLIILGSFFNPADIMGFVVLGFTTHKTEELPIILAEIIEHLLVLWACRLFPFGLHLRGL